MKILFVCKHNIFRSKIAETYFNKINKNKNIKASSAGVIPGNGLNKSQEKIVNIQGLVASKFGIRFKKNPRNLSVGLLKEQGLIILVANDVPIKIFNNKDYVKKVVQWNIRDVTDNNPENIKKIIKSIIKKVNKLNNTLN